MLPERLSNGVCSLKPQVDRLTHSVFIQFDKRGVPKSARFGRSVIRSAHRLTYKEAYAILTSPPGTGWGNGFILPGSLRRYCGENDSNTARWSLIFQR